MKSKFLWWILGGLGAFFILSSLVITFIKYQHYTQQAVIFPEDSLIAGVPVGGLDMDSAESRLLDEYSLPLTLKVDGSTIQVDPVLLGFSMNASELVEQAVQSLDAGGFWDYLWARTEPAPVDIPLAAGVNEDQLTAYLNEEIVPRYVQAGTDLTPIPFTTNFTPSGSGKRLDVEAAVRDVKAALLFPAIHSVTVGIVEDPGSGTNFQTLEAFLKHQIDLSGFDDLVEVYLESMETGEILHFAVQDGMSIEPDIAFTAASTIKVPVMVSVFRRLSEPTPEYALALLEQMLALSENDPADTLMQTYLDEGIGPLVLSEDMAKLGLENTFLGGYLYFDAPLLKVFETPANTRTDINLDPDIYSQIVASEAGRLLSGIYDCAADGSGLLTETFPGDFTQTECQLMVDILSANKIGVLIEAGVPATATVAHKHGWATALDGLLHSMSDVAIVYTDGGDYVLNIFINDAVRLDYEEGNRLFARLSQTVYNFFNVENQAYWWFD